ncbi:MAG: glycosyltransferase family 25 protein [Amaricoccus sp.]|uniref:glycosyltransferase family 25 protein n=1 Tax=Amaricoccus sp. TaxID=1872485 RepID=UPI0033152EC1
MAFAEQTSEVKEGGLLAVFDALYVINLPNRGDRRREFQAQLGRIGLSLDHSRVRLFAAIRPEDKGGFPDIGSRGCFMSHLGVMTEAAAEGLGAVIVCEDDLDFSRDFVARMATILPALERLPWDIAYAGFQTVPPGEPVEGHPDIRAVAPDHPIVCMHFMFYRAPALTALTAYLNRMLARPSGDPAGGPMHVDGALSRFRADHPELRTLVVVPALGHQRPSRTDIHALAWFDRAPLVRDVVTKLRRLRARLRALAGRGGP